MHDKQRTNLERILFERHISQAELARSIGTTRASICRKIKGLRKWNLNECISISKFLNCSIDDIFLTSE